MPGFSLGDLIADVIFGGIGFVAFVFGRKMGRWKTAVIGVLLMTYPWFISDVAVNYIIGLALTFCLFVFKD